MSKVNVSKNISIFVVLLMACMLLASQVMAQELSQEAKDRLKSSTMEMSSKTKSIRKDLCQSRMDLFKAYMNYNLDTKQVRAITKKINSAQLDLLNVYLNHQIEIRSILSADEFSRFINMAHKKMSGKPRSYGHREDIFVIDKKMLDSLNLSKDQMKRLQPYIGSEDHNKNVSEKLRNDTQQLINLYSEYNLDKNTARKLINSIHKNQVQIGKSSFLRQKAIRSVLTEDQFNSLANEISAKLHNMAEQRGDHHKN